MGLTANPTEAKKRGGGGAKEKKTSDSPAAAAAVAPAQPVGPAQPGQQTRPASSRKFFVDDDPGLAAPMMCLALAVVIMAIIVGAVWEVTDLRRTQNYDTPDKIYNTTYDIAFVPAPVATGWQLTLLSRLLISSPVGDFVVRHIMRGVGVETLVELAEALENDDGPLSGREYGLSDPLVRLSSAEYEWHVKAANETARDGGAAKLAGNRKATAGKYRSVRDFHNAYKSGATKPWQVVRKLVDFINQTDSMLRCVQELDLDGASQAAAESSARWTKGKPLSIWDGVPVMIKPEEDVKGLRSTQGRQVRVDGSDIATRDGVIAARLRAAGAIIIGTTVMHEKGVQPTGFNPWYRGPSNPFALDRFSGGSSSGSAVAVATGMVPVAIGWDGGGSIRIPAAWSGTVGLAPGYTRVPFDDHANVADVSKAGPLTGFIEDAAEALLLLGQPLSPAEGSTLHPWHVLYGGDGPPPPHLKPRWEGQRRQIRVGVFHDWVAHRAEGPSAGTTGEDDAVYKTFERALSALQAAPLSAEIVPFRIPQMHKQALSHAFIISALFSFKMISEGFKGSSSFESPQRDDDLQLATQIQLRVGRKVTAMELLAAKRIRAFGMAQWRKVLTETCDVILTPTTPMTAITRPEGSDLLGFTDSGLYVQMMRYIWPGNLVGLPGLAVPTGVDSAGLPVSMQVICLHWHEADCLAVGRALEQSFAKARTTPPAPFFIDLLAPDTQAQAAAGP